PDSIRPDGFPAKLWWLVNNPRVRSVCWDSRGRTVLIEEHLFVREVLGVGPGAGGAGEVTGVAITFNTKNFRSFVRQLNLYGFRKLLADQAAPASGNTSHLHCYRSPHFCRDRPDLIVHLKRQARAKKANLATLLQLPANLPPSVPG
ncbi:HSF5 protein, partial [Alcedo cyanopectus]|nr:HSF5 protein [Ceyx cyanopectus]